MADSKLSGDKVNEERAFIKRYTEGISGRDVAYQGDFSTPLEDRPRKVAVIGVPIADPPEIMDVDEAPSQDVLTLTVKSLKPPLSFTITAQPTDTIADLKTLVSKSSSSAPSTDSQRLLLKGKALSDTKLVKEYAITDGATLTLMLKAPTAAATPAPETVTAAAAAPPMSPRADPPSPAPPSLTISTEIDGQQGTSTPMTDANIDVPPHGPQPQISSAAFHNTLADPQFWQRIHALCVGEFALEDDADAAWETFLVSMKQWLSAGEAAKIRDVVGVKGMGGS